MSREALNAARAKARELIDGHGLDDTLGNTVRAAQSDFKAWLADKPDCLHEIVQHFLRGCVLHAQGAFARDDDDDDEPDYVKARREQGFHPYQVRE